MGARLSILLPVREMPSKVFVRLELETNHPSDHEFPRVLEDFIVTSFEPDAKIANLADRK